MQLTLEIPERNEVPLPSWGGKTSRFSKEYAEQYIKGTKETIRRHRMNKLSDHMDHYWNQGVEFYQEWIQVLNGTMAQDKWETKWKPIIDKYAGI